MKIMLHSSFIFLLILCSSANVYPCIIPAAPTNTTNSSKLSICEGLGTKLSVKGIGKTGWYDAPTGGKYLGSDTIYQTPILTKTTTFYVQDSTCEASATRTAITITVNPKPKADFGLSDSCGETGTFINKSKNAEIYLWIFCGSHDTSKSPKHFFGDHLHKTWGHFATLIVFSSKGCSDTLFKPLTINANPKSDFTYTSIETKVNFKAKQAGNTVYKWVFANRDSTLIANPIFAFPKLGTYTVCLNVTNAAGCFSKTCKEVSLTAGISDELKQYGFKIYPSPNSGSFTIEETETNAISTLEIFNQIGQIVHKSELIEHLNPMNLNLVNGIYLIRVTSEETRISQRMVVSK